MSAKEKGKAVLEALLRSGAVWIEDEEYLGTASDGETVFLGSEGLEDSIYRYLSDRPLPEQW